MPNNYYSATGSPSTGSQGSSSTMRAEFDAIEDAFDKLPQLSGNASKRVRINSGATAQEAVTDQETIAVALGDETTELTTGTKITFRMPYAFTVTAVRASLTTASNSGVPTFDINEDGVSILSTKLTIDANEKTSTTAAAAAVISDSSIADDAEITVDCDVAGSNAAGAKVYIIGRQT